MSQREAAIYLFLTLKYAVIYFIMYFVDSKSFFLLQKYLFKKILNYKIWHLLKNRFLVTKAKAFLFDIFMSDYNILVKIIYYWLFSVLNL